MKKCDINKEKFRSYSLQRHTVKNTSRPMNICIFLFSVKSYLSIRKVGYSNKRYT